MRKFVNLLKWGAILGKEPQNFLGAGWIKIFLEKVPRSKKYLWALRILSLSPHYFIDPENPRYRNLTNDQYLETAFNVCLESRRKIYEYILKDYLNENQVVLDYGCGPGFLAKTVAEKVKKIYACDISDGALACARILNNAPNLEYLTADAVGLSKIADESLDVIFSFALIQHLSDAVFESVLDNCQKKLKPGGKLVLHVQLENDDWRTEEQWKADQSITGKLKYRYGLHCFKHSKISYIEKIVKHGFAEPIFSDIAELVVEDFDDICSQQLLVTRKNA